MQKKQNSFNHTIYKSENPISAETKNHRIKVKIRESNRIRPVGIRVHLNVYKAEPQNNEKEFNKRMKEKILFCRSNKKLNQHLFIDWLQNKVIFCVYQLFLNCYNNPFFKVVWQIFTKRISTNAHSKSTESIRD